MVILRTTKNFKHQHIVDIRKGITSKVKGHTHIIRDMKMLKSECHNHKIIIKGGLGDGYPDNHFDRKQLKMGISVEKEHTPILQLQKEIAKDHLIEDKQYYTHLKEMEKKYNT